MASFNKVILMGNLVRDPEVRQTQSGTSVCRFSVAVNRSYTGQDGTPRDETCFVEVDCFGKTAENIGKYFTKGKPILVEGRLRQDNWDDKTTGQKRSKMMVVLERFEFVGSASGSRGGDSSYDQTPDYERSAPQARQQARPAAPAQEDMEDDDVPF